MSLAKEIFLLFSKKSVFNVLKDQPADIIQMTEFSAGATGKVDNSYESWMEAWMMIKLHILCIRGLKLKAIKS